MTTSDVFWPLNTLSKLPKDLPVIFLLLMTTSDVFWPLNTLPKLPKDLPVIFLSPGYPGRGNSWLQTGCLDW